MLQLIPTFNHLYIGLPVVNLVRENEEETFNPLCLGLPVVNLVRENRKETFNPLCLGLPVVNMVRENAEETRAVGPTHRTPLSRVRKATTF